MTIKNFTTELYHFTLKQIRACVFAGSFFLLLFASHHINIPGLPRYDFLFLGALFIQFILYKTKVETKDEVKMIFLFHIIGLILELFKTHPSIGSWSYPEAGYFKIMQVPLYSGFMYAAVGSYISQAWRLHSLRLANYPSYTHSILLSVLIYVNFFTHHFFPDIRYILATTVVLLFLKLVCTLRLQKKNIGCRLLSPFY